MAYFEKLWNYQEGAQYICFLCKATLRAASQFTRHVLRHVPDKSRYSCDICHVIRGERDAVMISKTRDILVGVII